MSHIATRRSPPGPDTPKLGVLVRDYLLVHRVGATHGRVLLALVRRWGDLTPNALTPSVLHVYLREPARADATRRRELGALQAVFRWAERSRVLPPGVAPVLDLPPEGQPRDVWMTLEQARTFQHQVLAWGCFRGRVATFAMLALHTAARRQAIEGLTWDRVDLARGQIDYREPMNPVTRKRRVPVPINEPLRALLERVQRTPPDSSPYVCGQAAIRYPYEMFCREHGWGWVTPHVLRHTAATLMLQAGVPIWDVAGVLGDTPETVARVYGHHAPDHLRRAVGALG